MTAIKVEFTLEFIGPNTNALASRIDFIKRTIKVDSLLIYESTVSQDLYRIEKSPLKYFDCSVGGDEYHGKLEEFKLMQEKFQFAPENILVLGDEFGDIEKARRLGFIEGACLWGSMQKNELKKFKPKVIFNKPSQLLNFLRGK